MGVRAIADFRNVALVGHAAAGKTTLGEAILFKAGVTTRLGQIDDGTSMLDYEDESKERKHSVEATPFWVEHQGKLLNFFDTPGMPDYGGLSIAPLAAVDCAAVVISAVNGIGVNTRRMYQAAKDYGLPRMIIITRIDADQGDLPALVNTVRETFGAECHPINIPSSDGKRIINLLTDEHGESGDFNVEHLHGELMDTIVEIDDALMERYMGGEAIPREELLPIIARSVASGHLVPILFVNARADIGVSELLDAVVTYVPNPGEEEPRKLLSADGNGGERDIKPDVAGDFCAVVVKITSDPKSNIKYSVARVLAGSLTAEGQLFPSGDRKGMRPGHIMKLRGNQHSEVPAASAGDIVAFAKLDLHIGQALFSHAGEGKLKLPKLPTPMYALALEPKSRADIEKVSMALHRFAEEDPCFQYSRDADTGELVMRGLGEMHLTVLRSKMKRYFKLEVDTKLPKIPYKETISGKVQYVEYTHKKQTGGAGQYGKVVIDMEPSERGKHYEFVDKIFGGVIDQAYRPSVDKGCREMMKRGVLAGCPIEDVRVTLVDGKTHPVDSKDIAFQIAGRQAFKKAFMQCKPILMEPVVNVEVSIPADFVGDITRDLSGKRGQIVGQDMLPGNLVSIRAVVPLAELSNYSSQLKSVTGGQGGYVMEFSHYDIVPPNVQAQIVASAVKRTDDDE